MPFPSPLGMSTKKDAAAGAPFQPTPVRASNPNNNDQRQGIIVAMVSCLLLFLTAYGILGLVQQIGSYDSVHMYGGSESFHKALKSKARGLMKPSMKKIVL